MLQSFRTLAGSIFAKILFGLLVCAFGIWGIGDFLRQQPLDSTVITVGDRQVSAEELQRDVQRRIDQFQGKITLEQAEAFGLVEQVVDDEVGKSLFDLEAEREHIYVSDRQVVDAITADKNFQSPQGGFDRLTFLNILKENNLSEGQYEAMLRADMPRSLAISPALSVATAPKPLTDLLYRIRHEERVADWVLLPAADKTVPAPDDAALREYYDKHHDAFTAPEYRGFTALALLPADVAGDVKITDQQLKDAYQQRLDEFTKPEKRHVLQMLLPDQKAADEATQQLQAGKDFTEVAKTVGKQDASTVDLGTIAKTELPPQTADAAFTATEGTPTKPVKTPFGFTIFKVTGIEAGGVKTFDEVKPTLEADLRKDAEQTALYDLSNKVEDAVSAGADLGQIAKQFKLTPITAPAIDREGKGPDGQAVTGITVPVKQLTNSLFDTAAGQQSTMQEIPNSGGFFVVRTDTITPPALKPLDQVTDAVKSAWLAAKKAEAVTADAEALVKSITADAPLAKLAAARHLQVTTTIPFTRADATAKAKVPPALVSRLFSLKQGEATSVPAEQGEYLAQLTQIKPADPTTDNAGVEQTEEQAAHQLADELLQQFEGALKQKTTVEIKRAAIDKLFPASHE
jgi:peptidyl-prolyl cis-trans isomerase D